MSRAGIGTDAMPPWTLAVAAMFSVQLSSALSIDLISAVGAAGTAWLRLTFGALMFVLIARPSLRALKRRDLPAVVGLGVATGLMTVAFLAAIDRIPLGTAVAIEFLGPLTVAAWRSPSARSVLWPVIALSGVVLVTRPWRGEVDLHGVGFAALAAAGWGTYIVLTQHVGDRLAGMQGLALTIPIAALTAAIVGIPQASSDLSLSALAAAAGLALLLPVLPFALEMLALRRMTYAAFGTLMALEPAIGVVLGRVLLDQSMSFIQLAGIALVVTAGACAQRDSRRPGEPHSTGLAQEGPVAR